MKNGISWILLFALLLGLCACGESKPESTEPAASAGLQIGYAKVDITPDLSVGLGGNSDMETRRSTGFADYIYIT